MTNHDSDNCLLCGAEIQENEDARVTVTVTGTRLYSAHKDCIEALKLMLGKETLKPLEVSETALGLVHSLHSEGWFSERRKLKDVVDECKRRGFNFTVPTIANVLRDLTRRGLMTRGGKTKDYSYIQKRPV